MKVTGKLAKVLELEQGTSKAGKEWVKRNFVIDTGDQYNPELCIECFGEEKVAMLSKLSEGDQVEVSVNISSREYKGRYYTQVSAWKIEVTTPAAVEAVKERFEAVEEDMPF